MFRTDISACDHCGLCCQMYPCLLSGYRDVKRLAKATGKSKRKIHSMLRIEIKVPATPFSPAKHQVRIRPEGGGRNGKCPLHIDNRCSVQANKPKGGKDFKCWVANTFDNLYFWSDKDLARIGFEV